MKWSKIYLLTICLLAIGVVSCTEDSTPVAEKNSQPAKRQQPRSSSGGEVESKESEKKSPIVGGHHFDPEDAVETAKWIRAIYKKCTKGEESYNYYRRKKAVEFHEEALRSTIGQKVRWQFQVIAVGRDHLNVQPERSVFGVAFSETSEPVKKSEELARIGVCYYITKNESFLETVEVKDKLYITGTVRSYFFNKATHHHPGFSLIHCRVEKP